MDQIPTLLLFSMPAIFPSREIAVERTASFTEILVSSFGSEAIAARGILRKIPARTSPAKEKRQRCITAARATARNSPPRAASWGLPPAPPAPPVHGLSPAYHP